MKYIIYYLIIINIITLIIFGIDKLKAIKEKSRVRNTTLFGLAILGGSIGALIGMHIFHHKTKTWYYIYGIPLILIIQIYTIYKIKYMI
ncbi:MAG: DUF1294 domain-containing protein [Bacilli bacterium]|nr:DUF1294 domain-containing protein [Bacilli bacterium]